MVKKELRDMKTINMFNRNSCVLQNFLFLFLSLFSCVVKKEVSSSDFIKMHSKEFDLNNLNWLWNFDYSKKILTSILT